ncbi:pentatricopeptide repeat-containing protein CRR2, chloroplastic-like [Apium graveolens]|uniref:pentatricopeptide repeat-containing protein CRR2, chloroplastic-like n=1 Tax=Apium graveolens TaxID=4045 RepID=UPI003D7A9310
MRFLGFHADHFTLPFVLKSCAKLFRVGLFDFAGDLFRMMSNRNIVSGTAMVSGYTQSGLAEKALGLFDMMTNERSVVKPNWVTIVCVLPACAHSAALERGKKIYIYASANGLDSNSNVQSALIAMYTKYGSLIDSEYYFGRMHSSEKHLDAWNTMVTAYTFRGKEIEAV